AIGEVATLGPEPGDPRAVADVEIAAAIPGRDAEPLTQDTLLVGGARERQADQLLELVIKRIGARTIAARGQLDRAVDLVIAVIEARARTHQRAAAAWIGVGLVEIVDREEVGLADLDHGSVRVGLEVVRSEERRV